MSALQDKYNQLVSYAQSSNVSGLSVIEQDGVLYVNGTATPSVKDQIWTIYNQIDPDMRAGDLVLDIEVAPGSEEIYEIKPGDSLSKIASKYSGITWQQIFDANRDTIKDPNMIHPGQKIKIPV
jgi:nucleoid-associated protein YgaU